MATVIRAKEPGDTVRGSSADEKIIGLGGAEKLYGKGGDDVLLGRDGDDRLDGGDGDDRLYGEAGDDLLFGRDGDDRLDGGVGDDRLVGGSGADVLLGRDGDDRLDGGDGDDRLVGGAGADVLLGRDGDDRLDGGAGADRLVGAAGADLLFGRDGDDRLDGGAGDDRLLGGAGADTLAGGLGADRFVFASLDDGVDTIIDFSEADGDWLELIGELSGAPMIILNDGADSAVWVSADGAATFSKVAVLQGYVIPDHDAPGQTITGTSGADDLAGTAGADKIAGLDGADTIHGRDGHDVIYGGSNNYTADPNDGADTIFGGGGNDYIDGGTGDDLLYGGTGRDYLFGGLGGNDVIDGEAGNDRLVGGFRGQADSPTDPHNSNVLIGGHGVDAFESRFWIKQGGWEGMSTTTLASNDDLVIDFARGVDKIDAVIYRQVGSRVLEFHQGGFEAFDTNGNGVIDANDDFATVGAVEYHGESRISITLDVGAANLASGRIGASEIEPGPHTITIWGETKLTADDFVPTNLYRGGIRASTNIEGTAESDYIGVDDRSAVIDGRAGDDLILGGGGDDTFTSRYTRDEAPGADLIADFVRGEDVLGGGFDFGADGAGRLNFAHLDSNGNGVLDDGDSAVRVMEVTAYQPGRGPLTEFSTVIDYDVAYGLSSTWTGTNSVAVVGVLGLTADDFAAPGAGV